jgi:threonine/homoserine/homoserine lactone efflux protein
MLTTFLLASLLLALSPGPGVLYIVTNSVAHGRRVGLISAAAMAVGNLVCGVVVVFALTALIGISSRVFTVLRYAGAAYLVYLGLRMILTGSRTSGPDSPSPSPMPVPSWQRALLDGLLVALLNPKTLLFFAAFLPQFMDPAKPSFLQGSLLVSLFVLIALITDSGYAIAAGWMADSLQQSRRVHAFIRMIGGGVLVSLGILALLT